MITYWNPNAATTAQVDTLTVTVAANGGTITVTCNGKSITYTMTGADTTATAAAALAALLQASTTPAEFQEMTWANAASSAVITATANTPGAPFTITIGSGGGATMTLTHTQANVSPSDVSLAANWLRNGLAAIPVNGDDVVLSNSSVGMLWNLNALAAVQFNSLTRYNSMTGQIGLPYQNANGYVEYRPTYFQFAGQGNMPVLIGTGPGNGPSLEKYNSGTQQTAWQVVGATAVYLLNTNVGSGASTYLINNATVFIGMLPGETANCSGGVTVINGGAVSIGLNVTFAGNLVVESASVAFCNVAPTTITANGGTVSMNAVVGSVFSVTGHNGSSFVWNSVANVTTLTLDTASTFTKNDSQKITITNSTIDSTCQIIDPWNSLTYTKPTMVNGVVQSGPFQFANRTVLIV